MAGILNKSARPFNLRGIKGKRKVTVRLIPGLNSVPDDKWAYVENTAFVKSLIADSQIAVGEQQNEAVLEDENVINAMVKEEALPEVRNNEES